MLRVIIPAMWVCHDNIVVLVTGVNGRLLGVWGILANLTIIR